MHPPDKPTAQMSLLSNGAVLQQFAENISLPENGTRTNVDSGVPIAMTMPMQMMQLFHLWIQALRSFLESEPHFHLDSLPRSLGQRSQELWPFSGPSHRLEGCQWCIGCMMEEAG